MNDAGKERQRKGQRCESVVHAGLHACTLGRCVYAKVVGKGEEGEVYRVQESLGKWTVEWLV